jgi:hypothetical protein
MSAVFVALSFLDFSLFIAEPVNKAAALIATPRPSVIASPIIPFRLLFLISLIISENRH